MLLLKWYFILPAFIFAAVSALYIFKFWIRTPNIATLERKRRTAKLRRLLAHRQAGVSREAARALGRLGDSESVQPLLEALADDQHAAYVEALGVLGDRSALPTLLELAGPDAAPGVRQAAITALGRMGASDCVPVLLVGLEEGDAKLREAAERALAGVTGEALLDGLILAAEDHSPQVRKTAVGRLSRMDDARACEVALRAAEDPSPEVRVAAVKVLARQPESRAMEPLLALLDDSDSGVAAAATRALAKKGASAVDPLLDVLKRGTTRAQKSAVLALKANPGPAVVEALLEVLGHNDDVEVLAAAEDALCELGALGSERLLELLGSPHPTVVTAAVRMLEQAGDTSAIPALIEALGHADSRVRLLATHALEEMSDSSAVEPLEEQLKRNLENPRGRVERDHLIVTLVRLGWQATSDETRAALYVHKDWYEDAAKLGSVAVSPLIQNLNDEWGIQERVVKALGSIADERAAAALAAAVCHDVPGAYEALCKQGPRGGDAMAVELNKAGVMGSVDNPLPYGSLEKYCAERFVTAAAEYLVEYGSDWAFEQTTTTVSCPRCVEGKSLETHLKCDFCSGSGTRQAKQQYLTRSGLKVVLLEDDTRRVERL